MNKTATIKLKMRKTKKKRFKRLKSLLEQTLITIALLYGIKLYVVVEVSEKTTWLRPANTCHIRGEGFFNAGLKGCIELDKEKTEYEA